MEKRGFFIDEVASRIRFTISMDSDFFMSIAKLRAARLLWSRIVAACGGNERSRRMRIHVRTALCNKTRLDPYVNMLRVTSEAFAAVLGGCESLQTGAFDEVIRPADEFSRRIARNTQIILREECNLDRVIDPGGGSYYLEKLTDDVARKTWELFREIEANGGILRALETGYLQNLVEESAKKKAELVALRRMSMIGTNVYANPTETPLDAGDWGLAALHKKRASEVEQLRTVAEQEDHTKVLAILAHLMSKHGEELVESVVAAAAHGATLGEISRALRPTTEKPISIRPIPNRRAATDFEELRAASTRSAAVKGRRPTVYLAGMGPLKQHKARADFSSGFFAAGGFEIISGSGFSSPEAAVNAAVASAADIVVICSTDETYPELVPPIARGLKEAAPQQLVVVAGLPAPELVEQFRQAGVDDFIHLRANCAEMLKTFLSHLGVYA
jgi:methylmalonyl-CoA mutase